MRRTGWLLASLLMAGAQTATARVSAQGTACPEHRLHGEVACYVVNVAEDPGNPDARTIPIRIMVLQSGAAAPAPDPLYVLPGGPGQSAIGMANLRRFFADFFDPVRRSRDVVLVDQRGTGGSNPLDLEPSADRLFVRPEMNIPPEWGRAAIDRLRHRADPAQYTTARAVDDLDVVRRRLGHEQINLYGTSYGTRVAQYYVKRHGESVRTAVLKAVAPPDANIALSYGRYPQRAFDRLVELCRQDPSCATSYPDLKHDLETILARLDRRPVTAAIDHPLTGEPAEFTIARGNFAFGVRSALMNAAAWARLPMLIRQASAEDFSAWAPFLAQVRAAYATRLHAGLTLSVIAAEDAPRLTEAEILHDASGTFIGDALARGFLELNDFWPRGEAPADLFTPLETDVPILLVSGALDPATPPEGAEAMLEHLPNGRHIVYAGGAHSAANFEGLDRIIRDFVESGTTDGLDVGAAVANRPLPFNAPAQ